MAILACGKVEVDAWHRYVDELLDRIRRLKAATQEPEGLSPAVTGRLSTSSFSPGTEATYHEVGSVIK